MCHLHAEAYVQTCAAPLNISGREESSLRHGITCVNVKTEKQPPEATGCVCCFSLSDSVTLINISAVVEMLHFFFASASLQRITFQTNKQANKHKVQ